MEKLLDCVMELGEQMLINGAEVHRVEDSIKRVFASYGTARTDVFIITSSMIVTIHTEDGAVHTQTRRITETATDFEKLHKLNELSRNICEQHFTPEEIRERLKGISAGKIYPLWLEFICYAVIAGAFTLFFGGGLIEGAVALAIGVLERLVILICDKTVKNKIFTKFTAALFATSLAYLTLRIGLVLTVDKVMIGSIMTLVPGIGLTTALKDLLVGDSIAGLLRTIEACIIALAIAAGYFAVAFLTGGTMV